jgi:hypothetical protein
MLFLGLMGVIELNCPRAPGLMEQLKYLNLSGRRYGSIFKGLIHEIRFSLIKPADCPLPDYHLLVFC